MTKQEDIATFLNRYVQAFPRCPRPWRESLDPYGWQGLPERPSKEAIARELLGVAEFRALQLGTWLNTTDGQIITEAVEMVMPPFYAEDVELLVEALKLAAAIQQREGRGKAVVGSILGVAAIVGLSAWGRAA